MTKVILKEQAQSAIDAAEAMQGDDPRAKDCVLSARKHLAEGYYNSATNEALRSLCWSCDVPKSMHEKQIKAVLGH